MHSFGHAVAPLCLLLFAVCVCQAQDSSNSSGTLALQDENHCFGVRCLQANSSPAECCKGVHYNPAAFLWLMPSAYDTLCREAPRLVEQNSGHCFDTANFTVSERRLLIVPADTDHPSCAGKYAAFNLSGKGATSRRWRLLLFKEVASRGLNSRNNRR